MSRFSPIPFKETISIGATIRTTALNVANIDTIGYAIRALSGAAPNGTWAVQYSDDYNPASDDPLVDTKWDTYTRIAIAAYTGTAVNFPVRIDGYEHEWLRLKYSFTSGTGSLLVIAKLKGIG